MLWSFSRRRRSLVLLGVPLFVLAGTLYHWFPGLRLNDYAPRWKPVLRNGSVPTSSSVPLDSSIDGSTTSETHPHETLGPHIIPEYKPQPSDSRWCQERYSGQYLEKIQETSTGLCTPHSQTNITCFHTVITSEPRIDMFCIGMSAAFDPEDRKFKLGCDQRDLGPEERQKGVPDLSALSSYWYDTGPQVLFERAVKLENNTSPSSTTSNFTILLKREGAYNLWHCMNEIWSMGMSLDVLRTTRSPTTTEPFFTTDDIDNTQIVILDDQDDGPYFDLWTMFAKKPIIRIKDISNITIVENVILPLAGASNPLWLGDWEVHGCGSSELLHTFAHRVLSFYKFDTDAAAHEGDLILTYIDRKESRRLIDSESYLNELQTTVPNLKVQTINFAVIPFVEQLKIIRETDILVGVHGAGLTHGMFLHEGSVMVEILPPNLAYKGFRNMADLAGTTYISAHGVPLPVPSKEEGRGSNGIKKRDWHTEDVYIEKERFMNLMRVAIKSLFNKGNMNHDAV